MIFRRIRRWWYPGGLLAATLASHGLAAEARADSLASEDAPPLADSSGFMDDASLAEGPMFGDAAPLADSTLDELRGGFTLPNGMDVTVGIDIQTMVNGALALRTVMTTADAGVPVLFVGNGSSTATSDAAQGGTAVTLPDGSVVRMTDGAAAPATAGAGQQQVVLTANGPAVSTPSGTVQLVKNDSGSQVILNGDALELRHIIGNFTGTVVANTANDRIIDTVVTVNVDLQNSAVPLGNGMLRWDSMAIEAAGRSIR